jgi:hypothetical protein
MTVLHLKKINDGALQSEFRAVKGAEHSLLIDRLVMNKISVAR